ncbi:hypothetical protein TNIN_46181 [Trichonephila inaurata madagascariensis]|uniref:Uncharacterized protein n=1 Tax=Trichonephila inaurata madagascariensis TaxID=2747483 RepID=A0A8X7C7R0_9ARAC|nr:hypothetical protein TNIN_46181 [Trichonephila inaurata madagascariensis]
MKAMVKEQKQFYVPTKEKVNALLGFPIQDSDSGGDSTSICHNTTNFLQITVRKKEDRVVLQKLGRMGINNEEQESSDNEVHNIFPMNLPKSPSNKLCITVCSWRKTFNTFVSHYLLVY